MEEASNPPTIYHFNRFKSATISAGLAPGKTMGDGIKEMEKIADEVLDETFSTSLSGSPGILRKVLPIHYLHLCWHLC